ncbi:hypothetical protein QA612_17330 [Evansella sp. AB-P1]|uniref:CBO0543 family protein n=1 Tax=Evansella sp. AB-P1 TaxID=3037653 RepID=UPI00241F21C4|nr:CBO0543 family protein [Evansella sp. AB-P1]MDG5789224.1 hypothetical protein [Evansella sp. AB-P1]
MKRNIVFEKLFLRFSLVLGLLLLPIIFRKPPIKDWLLVFLWNSATNGIIDRLVVSYNIIQYPVRLLPKRFRINILFDYLLYPIITVTYNQLTKKDKPMKMVVKLLCFTIPMILIEVWAERNTRLIKFRNGWKWYHSFISLNIKSLLTRLWIGGVRRIEEKQELLR